MRHSVLVAVLGVLAVLGSGHAAARQAGIGSGIGPGLDGQPLGQLLGQPEPVAQAVSANAVMPASESMSPASVLGSAGSLAARAAGMDPVGPEPDGGGFSAALNVMILLTVITLAPGLILMTTSFVRILIVLGLLRQAIGAQSIPPPQVLTALSLMLTMLVMAPTFERVWTEGLEPWQSGEVRGYDELWDRTSGPVRDFMFDQIEATGNWSSVYAMLNYRGIDTSRPELLTRADVPTTALVPAFMLSELKTAFLIGFRVYLPFLVIDIVIASLLISMGMMMLPPVLISLPFKLLLFVLVDGWQLAVSGLLSGFEQGGAGARLSDVPAVSAVSLPPPEVAWHAVSSGLSSGLSSALGAVVGVLR
ncbi:MAG: flagellar type III secretion system pore protein FliP [Planctomycetota bacterium]